MTNRNLSRPNVLTQAEEPVSINPVAALLIPPILLTLIAIAVCMYLWPQIYYTFKWQVTFMGGLGVLWLVCQFVVERGDGD